jgi:LPS sulfotransferase NodH
MHLIQKAQQKYYDFPYHEGEPKLTYMVASIPRSGSTFLSMLLWRTGCLGAPMEHANFQVIKNWMSLVDCEGQPELFWEKIKHFRTSPNGVYGYKMFMQNLVNISKNYPDLLSTIVPDKVICLYRKDIIAQAISYHRAVKSSIWFHGIAESDRTEYEFNSINNWRKSIIKQNRFWKEVFLKTDTTPLYLAYENLVANPDFFVSQIADFLNIKLDPAKRLNLELLRVQRDEHTSSLRQMYENELSSGRRRLESDVEA